MKVFACLGLLLWLPGCNLYGPCCLNTDCAGGNACSVDDAKCPAPGHPRGMCLAKCSVDRDCEDGYICDVFVFNCGCVPIGDGGSQGTCAPGVGDQ